MVGVVSYRVCVETNRVSCTGAGVDGAPFPPAPSDKISRLDVHFDGDASLGALVLKKLLDLDGVSLEGLSHSRPVSGD